ncbi:MAG: shikimate kinase [Oscillospiraceae bacterium]|nr:shikimate kinase [Oscillospiraceae bacterium]
MSDKMYSYGLLGEKLGHSFSQQIHQKLGLSGYELIETEREDLEKILCDVSYKGFNVTIPYKREVMEFCDEIDDAARQIGSVNTLVRNADGRLHGYNTDLDGFIYAAKSAGLDFNKKKILICGSGGTSLTVRAAAKSLGAARITVVSRSGNVKYENLKDYADSELIVNTTPVGMYPNNLQAPISLDSFPNCVGVIDVIYNPRKTALIMDAERRGIPSTDGLPMLVYQAKRAEELFLGKSIPDSEAARVLREIRIERGNIVLIGMPGSGKSSVAKLIASKTGRTLVDLDNEIEKSACKAIPQIFAEDGEEAFRAFEREETKKAGKLTGLIISTGGGVVKDYGNYAPLHQNGRIYYLRRELRELETAGRPLSKDRETLERLYNEREPLYDKFSDTKIENNSTLEAAAERIWEDYCENIGD